MEVFEAKFDYVKQRKDVLSFRKGDKFYIIDRPNDEWWSARKLSDDNYGYVPAVYLEKSKEQFIGRLIPEGRRNTREHDIHLQALAELHQRVKPLPAHVIGQALGVDVPKEAASSTTHSSANQRQKILIPDLHVEEFEQPEKMRSPSPLFSPLRSPRNSHKGVVAPPLRPRSPSPQPLSKPKSRNGSLRREEDSLPYHHKCNAAVERKDGSEDEDDHELPPHLRITPPPPVSSPPPPDYELDDNDDDEGGVPYHHKLNSSGRFIELENVDDDPPTSPPHIPDGVIVDDEGLIKPKPLRNPVKESSAHKSLHRELRSSGRSVLEGNELKKVFRDRNQRQTQKLMESKRTSLDVKLAERLKMEEQESLKNLQTLEKAATEPEFMKVQLKPRSGSGKT